MIKEIGKALKTPEERMRSLLKKNPSMPVLFFQEVETIRDPCSNYQQVDIESVEIEELALYVDDSTGNSNWLNRREMDEQIQDDVFNDPDCDDLDEDSGEYDWEIRKRLNGYHFRDYIVVRMS